MKKSNTFSNLVALVVFAYIFGYGMLKKRGRPSASRPGESSGESVAFAWPATLGPEVGLEPVDRRTVKNYYVVFDGSGSMTDSRCANGSSKISVAKRAVKDFAQHMPKNANLGLAVFDGRGLQERLTLGVGNQAQFLEQIDQINADGGTPLKSAITLAAERLALQAARQLGYGEYHLVIVTDGEAQEGEDPRGIVDAVLANAPVVVHTVGFCIGNEHSLNQQGRVVYQSADSPEQLSQGLADVLAEATTFNVDEFSKTK